MINRFLKRKREDNANGAFILGLMLIMALMLTGAIMFDLSKAYQLKSSYVNTARKATQAAIMKQSTEGYLTYEAAGEAIRVYESVRDTVIKRGNPFSECSSADNLVEYEVTYVDGVGGGELAAGKIKREDVSGDAKAISSALGLSPNDSRIINGKYRGIELTLIEGTENIMMPGAFRITQADEGRAESIKCQQLGITAKAEIFVGDKDGSYN